MEYLFKVRKRLWLYCSKVWLGNCWTVTGRNLQSLTLRSVALDAPRPQQPYFPSRCIKGQLLPALDGTGHILRTAESCYRNVLRFRSRFLPICGNLPCEFFCVCVFTSSSLLSVMKQNNIRVIWWKSWTWLSFFPHAVWCHSVRHCIGPSNLGTSVGDKVPGRQIGIRKNQCRCNSFPVL